ncbi:uncharacterized protein Fie [Periplaneta americana]|uniref:uncharacterized protein Fie n=1 Tax=Periplaneta americana TaxID=6978 RepID=UPI0037E74489
MAVPLRSCCYVFTLRQGTMLIAVIELLVSAIILFLLLLGSAHAQEIAAMLEADIEENGGGNSGYQDTEDASVYAVPPHHANNNEMRLHKGQHVALVMIIALYTAIAMVTIHLVSCTLLLYGSIMHVRQCLLPWLSVVVIGLVFSLASLLVCIVLGHGTATILLVTGLFIHLRLCLLLVVFSHYRQLYEDQVSSCASLVQRDATSIKTGYLHFPPPGKPSDV